MKTPYQFIQDQEEKAILQMVMLHSGKIRKEEERQ